MKKLLAIDGTEYSRNALREVLDRIKRTGDDLEIAVFDSDRTEKSLTDVEMTVRSILRQADLEVPVHRLDGNPPSDLVELADSNEFDRLLIGVRSRSPLGKIQLSDVAKYAVMQSDTSITLVRSLHASMESRETIGN